MKWILLLTRDGRETYHPLVGVSVVEEAIAKSEDLIREEWQERQKNFPYTEEFPAEETLFCESFTWGRWRKK